MREYWNALPGPPNSILLFTFHPVVDSLIAMAPQSSNAPPPKPFTSHVLTSLFRSPHLLLRHQVFFSPKPQFPNPSILNPKLFTHATVSLRVRDPNRKTKLKSGSAAAPLSVHESVQSPTSLHGLLDSAPIGRLLTQRRALPPIPRPSSLPRVTAQRSPGNVVLLLYTASQVGGVNQLLPSSSPYSQCDVWGKNALVLGTPSLNLLNYFVFTKNYAGTRCIIMEWITRLLCVAIYKLISR